MEGVIKGVVRSISSAVSKRDQTKMQQEAEKLLAEVKSVRNELQNVQDTFNMISDPDLIEAVIYEEKALNARYRHLLKLVRESRISCEIYEYDIAKV